PEPPGRLHQVNHALCQMLGYQPAELLEADLGALSHPEDVGLVDGHLRMLASGALGSDLLEHRLLASDGRQVWVQTRFSPLGERSDPARTLVAMLNDVTDRRAAGDELTHPAPPPPLTGLPNRSLITETLARSLARSRRGATGTGVLYLDLDDFKEVNDSLGHAAGDELLVEVAQRLLGCMRDSDVAGRMGGDEFVVVCEGILHPDDLTAVAERVSRSLAVRLPLSGRMVSVSASIGIAYSAGGGGADDLPEDLLRQADLAMYRAKANGRGRFEFVDDELQARATRQVELETDLRRTLATWVGHGARRRSRADDELVLDYQPCFDMRSGRLVACEALLRWRHPTRGLLGPGEFLDVAEDRSLMVPLGAWVLRTACAQAATWVTGFGDAAPEIWVNVSAGQLGRHRFASQVGDVLEETALPASLLCLELTERQALSTARATLEDLHALPDLGVRLMVDDFGTGYAGLEYLRKLPVTGIKVDASYVAAISTDATGAALAATVVGIGRALDLRVVAEGIETDEQRSAVAELGVDVLQGFLLGRPAPPTRVTELLEAQLVG
ncbi:MAG TPA: EAL domain-containing protein, partial [Actinotalea sp.]|nr:EAL domain-containing protein [Actinotalea sp.]